MQSSTPSNRAEFSPSNYPQSILDDLRNHPPEVLIIGGGIVGMTAAYELSLQGVRVAVLDRGEPGHGCSYGNAGWITPCFAMPLPQPGMLLKSIGWLLDPESPLYIHPKPSFLLVKWMTRFLLSMTHTKMNRSIQSLTEISKYSLDAYRKLHQEFPEKMGFEQKGLLMLGKTPAGFQAAQDEMHHVAKHGIPGRALTPAQVRELEPAVTGEISGGVFFPEEAHAEPLAVVQTLMHAAVLRGARMIPRTEVYDFEIENGKIAALRTTRGRVTANTYVLATGSWSVPIAKKLQLSLPILGGKGYSLILPPFEKTDPTQGKSPQIPLMLLEKKIAVTPRDGSIRMAGTLELVDRDESVTTRRVHAILKGARDYISSPAPETAYSSYYELWRGLRPCTPDGVPVAGFSRNLKNLFVLAGHQMLGLQSAPGTGRLTADLILGKKPSFDPEPFRADRF